jgi:hypothetical protein
MSHSETVNGTAVFDTMARLGEAGLGCVLSLSDYAYVLLFIWRFVWGLYERAHIIRYFPPSLAGEARLGRVLRRHAGRAGPRGRRPQRRRGPAQVLMMIVEQLGYHNHTAPIITNAAPCCNRGMGGAGTAMRWASECRARSDGYSDGSCTSSIICAAVVAS